MRNRFFLYAAVMLLLLFFSACSTQKNTWSSRHYHDLTTRYNIHFNGHEAYKRGMKQLQDAHKDDYTKFLPIYAVSNHKNAESTASNMNRSIEKCQKAIKKHSIRVKPDKKPNSRSSAERKLFYSKEEFNPFMDDVFLLMANSQFHKGDFLSASSTCSYIIRHFSTDKRLCDKAGILMARAYTELEWYYDAENVLNNLNKESLTPSLNTEFSSTYADFLIRKKKYSEAIPFLEIAVQKARKKVEKYRWSYLLGQIYQETGKTYQAYKIYSSIPGMNPPYEMELSARIRQTEVYPGTDPQKPLKKLTKLSRSSKNKEYLDQIYYALGNLYFAAKDTAKAIKSYHTALEKSTQNGPHKLKALLALGDFYYKTEQFIQADSCYAESLTILGKEDERYALVSQRAEILKVLAPHLVTIHDEDSLQTVAKMSKEKRDKLIDGFVKAAEKKAKEEKRLKDTEEALSANQEAMEDNATPTQKGSSPAMPQISTDKNWYFYNPTTIGIGLTEFRRKWGNRSLKDDWRRNNKTALFENTANAEETGTELKKPETDSTARDSIQSLPPEIKEGTDDPLNPNFYLKNLPFTEEQLKVSNEKIAEALYNSGLIYREQMENDRLALNAFRELETRYPKSPWLENAYYITYLMLKQQKRDAEADIDRNKQIALFPESHLAKRLDDSLFIEKLIEMYQVQDTLYAKAYHLYLQKQTDSIFYIGHYVEENYPVSPLIPKFTFLQAMESARTGKPEDFHRLLTYIVDHYPKSDLIPTITQMLAYWNEGRRPVPSAGYTNLFSMSYTMQTDSVAKLDSLAQQFKFDPAESHVMLISYPKETTNINKLQFDVALYNFTNFLIRDYDLSFAKVGQMDVLLIRGFENAEDVMRYKSWIVFQNEKPEDKYPGIKLLMVSDSNLKLLESGVPPEKYLEFFEKNYADIRPNP
ncbi:MAG: tetratricopeptide repeat protein [Bacteroidales bacterium]|nr:tetratricopeptide repeat protein [Bacteroidales bacterium]